MDKEKIEHEYTDEIVCPYCGNEFSDSWELGDGEDIGELECDECNKKFTAYRNLSKPTYSTEKLSKGLK